MKLNPRTFPGLSDDALADGYAANIRRAEAAKKRKDGTREGFWIRRAAEMSVALASRRKSLPALP